MSTFLDEPIPSHCSERTFHGVHAAIRASIPDPGFPFESLGEPLAVPRPGLEAALIASHWVAVRAGHRVVTTRALADSDRTISETEMVTILEQIAIEQLEKH